MQETWVQSLGQEDSLEKGMATHCSILAWRITWTEEPGGLYPYGCKQQHTTERLTHYALLAGTKTCSASMQNCAEVRQKLGDRAIIWSRNLSPGCTSKGYENRIWRRWLHSHVSHSIIHNSQDMETTKVSINRWLGKDTVTYIYIYIYTQLNIIQPWERRKSYHL